MTEQTATRMQHIAPFYVMELLQRAQQLQQQGRDVIHMEIGEPDFPTPTAMTSAAIACLQAGNIKYTAAAGLPELRTSIAEYYRTRYGVRIPMERIFITPGASGALLLAFGVSVNAGDKILMADPCYPCNSNFLRLYGAEPQLIATDAATCFQLHAELLRRHWNRHSKGVLIASPSNPTGTLIGAGDLAAVINEVLARDGHFYSDEIYHGLEYGDKAVSALQFSNAVFVINSFSKYFGMTGWRVGWLIVPEAFCPAVEKLAQNLFIATATPSQYAALAAFESGTRQELEQRREAFEQRRDFLYAALTELGFEIACKPEGAFYLYANCARFCSDSYQFARDLLEAEAVAVTPGIDFGSQQAEKHLRFAYTTSLERLDAGVRRLQRFIAHRG